MPTQVEALSSGIEDFYVWASPSWAGDDDGIDTVAQNCTDPNPGDDDDDYENREGDRASQHGFHD